LRKNIKKTSKNLDLPQIEQLDIFEEDF
jgi:hypothetical protein